MSTCRIADIAPILAPPSQCCANSLLTNPKVEWGPMSLVVHLSPLTNMRSKYPHFATVLGALLILGLVNIAIRYWLSRAKAFVCAILCNYRNALLCACMHTITLSTCRRSCMYFALLVPLNSSMPVWSHVSFIYMKVQLHLRCSTRWCVKRLIEGMMKVGFSCHGYGAYPRNFRVFSLRNHETLIVADFLGIDGFPAVTLFIMLYSSLQSECSII